MAESIDIWKLLLGVAFFLLGMNFLEDALKNLAGRPFKLFLRKQTSNNLKAIAGGAIVTALLQSSSVVNLMVLAFVGSGVILMENALAVILGANLGTTLSSWIIATVGFKFNIENLAFPVSGISGILMMLTNKQSKWNTWFRFLFGIGMLFVGLDFMKTGVENAVKNTDLTVFNKSPLVLFLFIGFIITSIIQASSATMAIALSALYANAITLPVAMAIVLGSETGTSLKLIIASIKGLPEKKRVSLGNLLFNVISTILVFSFLMPIHNLIIKTISIKDHLIALVFFQTLVNVFGILLFYPFLKPFGRFLEKRFRTDENDTIFIHKVSPSETEPAMAALEKEEGYFFQYIIELTMDAFELKDAQRKTIGIDLHKNFKTKSRDEKYEYIKQLNGEIYSYYLRMQAAGNDEETIRRLEQLISVSRNLMYAAKNLKDIFSDIEHLKNSSNNAKYAFYQKNADKMMAFYSSLGNILSKKEKPLELIKDLFKKTQNDYRDTLSELYKEGILKHLNEVEFSTLINFNREVYTLFKSVIFALIDYKLQPEERKYFDELPGFIR